MHPPNFHTVLTDHYRERLASVIAAGNHGTPEYYFVRNALAYHSKQ